MAFFDDKAPWLMNKLINDFDLDVEDAAAIVGNGGHESAGFKTLQEVKPLVPGSRGGYGIMQWTGPRRRAYEAYCARNKLDPAAISTNYAFLFVELKGPEGRVLPKLRAAKGLDAKVEVFSNGFLRPGIPHMDSRKVWAKRAMAAWEKYAPVKAAPEAPVVAENPMVKEVEEKVNEKTPAWLRVLQILIKALSK